MTGETRVLASTTSLPRGPLPQGIKVYEDETKGTRPPPRPCLAPFPGLSQIRQPDWTQRCPVWVPGPMPRCPLLAPKPFSPEPAAHPSFTPGTCPGAWAEHQVPGWSLGVPCGTLLCLGQLTNDVNKTV